MRESGHEPVVLDLEEHDLHRVGAVWVPEDPGAAWRAGASLLADLSIAVDRGMPLLLTGAGVVAATETGLLPGKVTAGRGGRRTFRVASTESSWTIGAANDVETTLTVDASRARWAVDQTSGVRVVARWTDDEHWDVAALASASGNVVGLLADLEASDDGSGARSWLANPVPMLNAVPLAPVVGH